MSVDVLDVAAVTSIPFLAWVLFGSGARFLHARAERQPADPARTKIAAAPPLFGKRSDLCDEMARFVRSLIVAFWVLLAVSLEAGWLVVVGSMALWSIRRIVFAL